MTSITHMIISEIPVEIRRNSRRKTRIGLGFDPAGHVILDAPVHVSLPDLEAAVIEHKRWIHHRLSTLKAQTGDQVTSSSYEDGDLLSYLGDTLHLSITAVEGPVTVERIADRLCIDMPRGSNVREIVRHWYRRMAQGTFTSVLKESTDLPWVDEAPPWRQQFMRSQWGSCSARGRLSLNTHLIQTPIRLIEYVILHELCHLKHLNHSPRFYGLLERHMPDWDLRRRELKKYLPVLLRG